MAGGHRGNPYHDRLGRFTTASGCCSATLQHTPDDASQEEREQIEASNARIVSLGQKGFEEQHQEEIDNGAKVLVYTNGNEVRYGIVDVDDIDQRTVETGGSSTEVQNNAIPNSGYMVAYDTSRETWLSEEDSNDPDKRKQRIAEFAEKNKDILTRPNMHLGTWRDPETGKISLDISERETNEARAKAKGRERNQKAIFNLGTFEDVDTGGTGNNTNSSTSGSSGISDVGSTGSNTAWDDDSDVVFENKRGSVHKAVQHRNED